MIMRTRLAILACVEQPGEGRFRRLRSALLYAYDYPWCVMGGEARYSGDCSYQTRDQCLASASAMWMEHFVRCQPRALCQQAVEQQVCQQSRGGATPGLLKSACGRAEFRQKGYRATKFCYIYTLHQEAAGLSILAMRRKVTFLR